MDTKQAIETFKLFLNEGNKDLLEGTLKYDKELLSEMIKFYNECFNSYYVKKYRKSHDNFEALKRANFDISSDDLIEYDLGDLYAHEIYSFTGDYKEFYSILEENGDNFDIGDIKLYGEKINLTAIRGPSYIEYRITNRYDGENEIIIYEKDRPDTAARKIIEALADNIESNFSATHQDIKYILDFDKNPVEDSSKVFLSRMHVGWKKEFKKEFKREFPVQFFISLDPHPEGFLGNYRDRPRLISIFVDWYSSNIFDAADRRERDRKIIRHEIQHYEQYTQEERRELKIGQYGRPEKYFEDKYNNKDGWREDHAIRGVEFYTRLSDEIEETVDDLHFKLKYTAWNRKEKESILRAVFFKTINSSYFFKKLKENRPNWYKKATKIFWTELYKEFIGEK